MKEDLKIFPAQIDKVFWNRKAGPFQPTPPAYSASLLGMTHAVPRILCVDDDPLFQRFVAISLRRTGYELVTATDGLEGCETLERLGADTLSCVMIDRRMPRMDGLEFLDWLRRRDKNLSAIVITAEGEKEHVEKTLRAGACNFLDKPVTAEGLREAVIEAVGLTHQRRNLAQLRDNVDRYGRYLRDTITSLPSDDNLAVDSFYLPKHEAGGDFLAQLRIDDNRHLILLTDVSGHDLWSAQWSAYFYGFLNGSLRGGASVQQTLERFNELSIEKAHPTDNLSIAVSALLLDRDASTMTIFCCGAPLPVWVQSEQGIESMRSPAGPPLGWFGNYSPPTLTVPIPSGAVYLWTDGIDDLAQEFNVSALSVAQALLKDSGNCAPPDWVSSSNDDLLVARVFPSDLLGLDGAQKVEPLIVEHYRRDQIAEIDALQRYWENSLRLALPELDNTTLSGILLSAREAAINALEHGCREGEEAAFHISYQRSTKSVSVHISDPGPGYSFSVGQHTASDRTELVDKHRGLMLIESFATNTVASRNGADLRMEFSLS